MEVTIAMGVIAFALLTLLGILPIGLMATQEALHQTVRSHILQQISGDLNLLPFSQIETYLAQPQYFDYDGKKLEGSQGAAFVVNLDNASPVYPGSFHLEGLQERLERVAVSIHRPSQAESSDFHATLSVFNSNSNP